ncbi:MAG: cache domain-containing protein [Deltaproteobacteria bacterium]|nr:cache domain-containing protein [Deltaproteobacteria bacterium]
MIEIKTKKQALTLGIVFFLLIVIPLSLMAFLIANGMFNVKVTTLKEKALDVIDKKSQDGIKARAVYTADEVAVFLMECKKDLLMATIFPQTEDAYKWLVAENKRPLWRKENNVVEQVPTPIYREIALIDKNGNEKIKIADGQTVPPEKLVNVSNLANTTYKSEDYFATTKTLNKGDVYVSPVTGYYITKAAFENGERFAGIIRFSTPVFSREEFAGVLTLAVDYRHLAKFTDQIIPTEMEVVFEADASTGNYAYMVDSRNFVISHPYDYHIVGLKPDGTSAITLSAQNAEELKQKGEEALNLMQLGFLDPKLPVIAKEAAKGESGIMIYKFGGFTKLVAYAPIRFYASNLTPPAGFGWVAMGLEIEKYNKSLQEIAENIEKGSEKSTATVIIVLIFFMVILFFMMLILLRGITLSKQTETPKGSGDP